MPTSQYQSGLTSSKPEVESGGQQEFRSIVQARRATADIEPNTSNLSGQLITLNLLR